MRNKKGFTLIELLAIIVILAVIMVIAVPQILNVVNGSKNGAWKNNVNMIERAITKNSKLVDPETGFYKYTIDGLCSNTSKFKEIVKADDTSITCSNNVFTLTGTGQFTGKSATITCTNNKCSVSIKDGILATGPGLYDLNNNMLASWDELINTYHMNMHWLEEYENFVNYTYIDQIAFNYPTNPDPEFSYFDMGVDSPGFYYFDNDLGKLVKTELSSIDSYAPAVVFSKIAGNSLVKLVLDSSIKEIPFGAFNSAVNLETVVLNEGLETIGDNAFTCCSNLKHVFFSSTVTSIVFGSFSSDYNLVEISLPAGLRTLGEATFAWCMSLQELNIPEGITAINMRLFEGNENMNIKRVTIPSTATEIERFFTIPPGNDQYDISDVTITFADPSGWYISSWNGITNYQIPSTDLMDPVKARNYVQTLNDSIIMYKE